MSPNHGGLAFFDTENHGFLDQLDPAPNGPNIEEVGGPLEGDMPEEEPVLSGVLG